MGKLPLKIVAPITDFKPKYELVPWMVTLKPNQENNLNKISVIDLFQVRSISELRLIKKIGIINNKDLEKCKEALFLVFE